MVGRLVTLPQAAPLGVRSPRLDLIAAPADLTGPPAPLSIAHVLAPIEKGFGCLFALVLLGGISLWG